MKFMAKTLIGLSLLSPAFCTFSQDTDREFETDPKVVEFFQNYDMNFLKDSENDEEFEMAPDVREFIDNYDMSSLKDDDMITLPDGSQISGFEIAFSRALGDAMGKAMGEMVEQGSKAVAEGIAKSIAETTYNIATAPIQGLSEAANADSDHSKK